MMEDRMILNPSCSEAVMRLNVEKLDKLSITKVTNQIRQLEIIKEGGDNSVFFETIFGKPIISIKGEAPYNEHDKLEAVLRSIPELKDVKIETGEA
jgi:hypothetical protein